jgi:hypothetical protein
LDLRPSSTISSTPSLTAIHVHFHHITSSVSSRSESYNPIVSTLLLHFSQVVVQQTWLFLLNMPSTTASALDANMSSKTSLDQLRPHLSGKPMLKFETPRRSDSETSEARFQNLTNFQQPAETGSIRTCSARHCLSRVSILRRSSLWIQISPACL